MFNVPTTTTTDISFGPAVMYLGPAGATPSVDVGAIAEDGISFELTREVREISQGSPRIPVMVFDQAQNLKVMLKSIEWDFNNIASGFGSGTTSVSGADVIYEFGGSPFPNEVGLKIVHQMPTSGHTLDVLVWRAQGSGNYSISFGGQEHEHAYEWTGLLATTDWGGTALGANSRLARVIRHT